jgi:hypothetical protein
MWDWGVLVGGLVAGDRADITALMIDVDLAGGRIGQQVPFVRRRRIGIARHIDDWSRRRCRRRRCCGASRNRDRQEQGKRSSRNPWIHDESVVRAEKILKIILSPYGTNRKRERRPERALLAWDAEDFAEMRDGFLEAGAERGVRLPSAEDFFRELDVWLAPDGIVGAWVLDHHLR